MSAKTFVISLPDEVVEQFQQYASAGNRTIEDVILETLTNHQPEVEAYDKLLAPLARYSDERLWQVVNETLTQAEKTRYETLAEQRQSTLLQADEQTEFNQLVDKIEKQMLFRSEALALLKERGHDISRFINKKTYVKHS